MFAKYKDLAESLQVYFGGNGESGNVFSKYLPDFLYSANNFALATGQISGGMSDNSLLKALCNQAYIVLEEINEFLDAKAEEDINEMYDAIIDIFYTLSNYDLMALMYAERELEDVDTFRKHMQIKRELNNVIQSIEDVEQTGLHLFSDHHLYQSARLIEENNNLKYTDNMVEFLNWGIDDTDGLNTMRVMNLVTMPNGEDKIFFCLKDQNGKIRKHKNFQKVDLSFVNGK